MIDAIGILKILFEIIIIFIIIFSFWFVYTSFSNREISEESYLRIKVMFEKFPELKSLNIDNIITEKRFTEIATKYQKLNKQSIRESIK